jgi:pSer/pThr/pTyr-binding forkhead associated (FHA) protein
MKLIIEDDEGRKTVVPLVREEITIGRQDGNTIRLTERNVSRRHARLVKDNGSLLIEDLGSYNGVRVNGEKISGPTKIKEGDLVEIGDYDLGVQGKFEASTAPAPNPKVTVPPSTAKAPAAAAKAPAPPPQAQAPAPAPAAPPPAAPPPAPEPQQAMPSASAGGATAIIRVSDIMKSAPQVEARDLQRNEMPRLVGLSGPARGKELILMRSEVKFGRTDENDISIDHQSVSRQHCKFVLDQGQWKVIDNKSANGVRVNGDEYAVSNVKPGDTLELGHLKFRFCGPGEKFTPPPEKAEEGAPKGGMKPTTAELIAGASQPGRISMSTSPGPAAKKAGPPIGLIAGIGGAVVVLAVVAFFVIGNVGSKSGAGGEVGGGDAVKAGDVLFKQKKFLAASEMYEKAGEAPAPNKKKAADEARGEQAYNSLKQALESGDADKAKNLFEKCAAESTFYCQKAQEMADPVKASYAKKHLQAANAAKTAGKLDACMAEINNVLAFVPENAEAQALQSQCQPAEPAPKTEKHEGPSPKEREAKAGKSARDSMEKLNARDFPAAIKAAQAALAQNPSDKSTLGLAYRSLGYGHAYLNDRPNATKWLEKYLPYCAATANDCAQVNQYLGK